MRPRPLFTLHKSADKLHELTSLMREIVYCGWQLECSRAMFMRSTSLSLLDGMRFPNMMMICSRRRRSRRPQTTPVMEGASR